MTQRGRLGLASPVLVDTPGADLMGWPCGTQTLGTLIAVYGVLLMTPLGWGWALFV
jgi:hypothetical protein